MKTNQTIKCQVCGSVMFPDLQREGGYEELRYRCLKDCRGSGYSQVRRVPSLWPERKVTREDFKREGKENQGRG